MSNVSLLGLLFGGILLFGGCTTTYNLNPYTIKENTDLTVIENETRIVTAKLFSDYLRFSPEKRIPIIFTSLVNLHDLSETSNFGRTFSELAMTNFAKHNVTVYDYRAKNAISVSEDGEFFLSRDANKIKQTVGESYVFAGSYSVSEKMIIVNARLINIKTGEIVSAVSTTIKDKEVLKTICQSGLCGVIDADSKGKLIKIISEDCKDPISCKQK